MSTTEEPIQYDDAFSPEVGVGPHPLPWPQDERYDPQLLADGDRRNVVDHYRYWTREAIVADLDARRHGFHVAVENWGHDFNCVYGRGVEVQRRGHGDLGARRDLQRKPVAHPICAISSSPR